MMKIYIAEGLKRTFIVAFLEDLLQEKKAQESIVRFWFKQTVNVVDSFNCPKQGCPRNIVLSWQEPY